MVFWLTCVTIELVLMILKHYEKLFCWIMGAEGSSENGYEFFINFAMKSLWYKKERLSKPYRIFCHNETLKNNDPWKVREVSKFSTKCFTEAALQRCSYKINATSKATSNLIEITLWYGCSTVNLLHIFRIPFPKNTSGGLALGLSSEFPLTDR